MDTTTKKIKRKGGNTMITNLGFLKRMAVIFLLVPFFVGGSAFLTTEAPFTIDAAEVARPSNPGGPGEAIKLTGNLQKGAEIFNANCLSCHNTNGKGGIPNPGSADGTVPALNPIDPTLYSKDYETFAQNIDLFIQHGSTPEGNNPALRMTPFGDQKILTQQQIADVIAYIISLNKK
jgi:mono/diheme cytochrome c family protein